MKTGACQRWFAVALLLSAALPLAAADVHVAVAANFSAPLQKLAPLFEKSSGDQLVISSGSSGQLYTQIRQGAPFDVFLSADTDKPALLENEGLIVPGSRFVYAIGALVLWSPHPGVVDDQGKVLDSHIFRYIGIANPQTAPYGTAARQLLCNRKLWDPLNQGKKIVTGENITQTWQFAATGNVDMAFVALSQVIGPDGKIPGSAWQVPQSQYDPIEQQAVALAHGSQPAAAQAFLTWLRTDPNALAAIRAAGYRTAN